MMIPRQYILIDDDPTCNLIGEFIIRGMDPHGQINSFQDPEEALLNIGQSYNKRAEKGETILFLDLNMPRMTGWEFLDVFKTLKMDIQECFRIYILTSSIEDYSSQKDRFPFIKGVISKPLKNEKLREILAQLQEE